MEMIGDCVFIECDGKFEFVDVSEIKVEYFDMLGILDINNYIFSEGMVSDLIENNVKNIEEEKFEKKFRLKIILVDDFY